MENGNHVSPCGRGGSNSHALVGRQILSRASEGQSSTDSTQGGAGRGTSGRPDVTIPVTRGPATFVTNVVSVQHTKSPAPRATPRQGEPASTPSTGDSDGFGHGLTRTTHESAHPLSGSFYEGGRL